ncbi:hypothetical protein BHE74_00027777, partial [Ensete ventricosum]
MEARYGACSPPCRSWSCPCASVQVPIPASQLGRRRRRERERAEKPWARPHRTTALVRQQALGGRPGEG